MSFSYTRSQIKQVMNSGIFGKQGMLLDVDETINSAVREVFNSMDFRSARRKQNLVPNLYNGVYDYLCPSDLHSNKIIDIPAQAKRSDNEFFLVPVNEFEVKKEKGTIAIDDFNGTRVLKINSQVDSKTIVLSELDSLTSGGGTWTAFGDATAVGADTDDYIHGNGSVAWDINASAGTTAGIENTSLNAVDISDYLGGTSSIFVWARINSTTNLTNYILRFGSSATDYYSKTVTTQHDGTAFVSGWNLLRFDISSLTTTGSPDATDVSYVAIYMTKTSGKVSESDYKFDYLVLKRGVVHNVKYYSKFGWQSNSGTYLENSTSELDVLVADTDEYQIIKEKVIEMAAREVREFEVASDCERRFSLKKREYELRNPSEAKIMTSGYYDY